MTEARALVVDARIALGPGCDPAAVGAAVTVELCGHWDHDGPCRWPHNSAIETQREPASFRTLVVADGGEERELLARIEASLRRAEGWRVVLVGARPVAPEERQLAQQLLAAPRSRPRR
jgi:hypothetical protein